MKKSSAHGVLLSAFCIALTLATSNAIAKKCCKGAQVINPMGNCDICSDSKASAAQSPTNEQSPASKSHTPDNSN